jgi:hypothetical protein
LIRGSVIAFEEAQQFENAGAGIAGGTRIWISHVAKS